MMNGKRLLKRSAILLLPIALGLFAIYGPWVFAKPAGTYVSPKEHYRLEYLSPGPPYFFSFTKQHPRFVRFYDNRTGKLLGESQTVDMNGGNGRIHWPSKELPSILVGMEIEFPATPEQ